MAIQGLSMPLDQNNLVSWTEITKQADAYLGRTGWPDKKSELWKFTSLAHLTGREFISASADVIRADQTDINRADIDGVVINITAGHCQFADLETLPDGLHIEDIGDDDARLAEIFGRLESPHLLTALSANRQTSACAITLDSHRVLEKPIVLNFTGGQHDEASHPFIYIDIGSGAQLKLAERHKGGAGLSCPLIIVDVGQNVQLDHIKFQDEARGVTHLGLTQFWLENNSEVNSFSVCKGGEVSRLETHSLIKGSHAKLTQSAIYLGGDRQHHDITSYVAHEEPQSTSHQNICGVLDNHARGVFQGKVRVAPDAQKTDGQQMSRILLLSRDAEANAKPELEIFADDVLCSHGATVGELDENLIFYLKSRGLPQEQARSMLIDAFLVETLGDIAYQPFADYLYDHIANWTKNQTDSHPGGG